ncbi:MAG: hypothetical protein RLZZ44_1687 [Bacteroidota bacterium]
MKKFIQTCVFLCITATLCAQETQKNQDLYTAHNKGKFFVSWGGNRETYSKSDIHFKGSDYDFTIYDVTAHDKPKGWHIDYLNPGRMTIPQTNFRMGYFVNDHYSVAIGVDHMKYVMNQDIVVNYTGSYPNRNSFGEAVGNNQILLTEQFLTFEHTDGLNYVNTEISRHDDISTFFNIQNTDKIQVNLTEGIGAGFLYPKTNAKVFSKQRHDDFHIAGYGASIKAGLNLTFFKHFYIQTEVKGGYINMPDIKTTFSDTDSADQKFLFFQKIIAFGGIFKI